MFYTLQTAGLPVGSDTDSGYRRIRLGVNFLPAEQQALYQYDRIRLQIFHAEQALYLEKARGQGSERENAGRQGKQESSDRRIGNKIKRRKTPGSGLEFECARFKQAERIPLEAAVAVLKNKDMIVKRIKINSITRQNRDKLTATCPVRSFNFVNNTSNFNHYQLIKEASNGACF